MYRVTALGHSACHHDDGRPIQLPPTAFLLLTFLSLQRNKVTRTAIIRTFWPGFPMAKARHSLSQLLYRLRTALGPKCIEVSQNTLSIRTGEVLTDVDQLRAASAARSWYEAVRLYGGDFLGSADRLTPALEAWRDEVDAEIRALVCQALDECAANAERAAEWNQVERYARDALRLGPGTVRIYERLVEAVTAQGRVHEAQPLRSEAEELFGAEWTLQSPRLDDSTRMSSGHASGDIECRFLGRSAEFSLLRHAWDSARRGSAVGVLITGEGGIGKTRLAAQLHKLAILQGGAVLACRCTQVNRRVSYSPLTTIADQLPGSVDESLPHASREFLSHIRYGRADSIIGTAVTNREFTEATIIHTFSQAIRSYAHLHPVVILIDDCQWIDLPTADLLLFLLSANTDQRLMVVAATRSTGTRSKGASVLAAGLRDHIHLTELSHAECIALAESYLEARGHVLDGHSLETAVCRAAGNPFFLLEIIAEQLSDHSPRAVPVSISALLESRIRQLSRGARRVLAGLAVAETAISPRFLGRMLGVKAQQLVAPTQELLQCGLLRIEEGGVLSLKHTLILESIYSSLPQGTRTFLHNRVARGLIATGAASGAIAHHAHLAGNARLAVRQSVLAAEEAEIVGAHRDARHWYELAFANASTTDDRRKVGDRLLCHAIATSGSEHVEPFLAELNELFFTAGDVLGQLRCKHAGLLIAAHNNAAPATALAEEMRGIVARAQEEGDTEFAVQVLRDQGTLLQHTPTRLGLLEIADRILAIAKTMEVARRAQLYAYAAFVHAVWGTMDTAKQLAEDAVVLAENSSDVLDRIAALGGRAVVNYHLGDLDKAEADYAAALKMAESTGVHSRTAIIQVNFGVLLIDRGDYARAGAVLSAAKGTSQRRNPFALANLAVLAYEQRDWDNAMDILGECEEVSARIGAEWLHAEAVALRGLIALSHGDRLTARQCRDTLFTEPGIVAAIETSSDTTHTIALGARLASAEGRIHDALEMLSRKDAKAPRMSTVVQLRIELEKARILIDSEPDLTYTIAASVRKHGTMMGALALVTQSQEILDELALRAR